MTQSEQFQRARDAGADLAASAQARVEDVVRDLLTAGERQAEETRSAMNDLVDRSRRNSEKLVEQFRKEVRDQVKSLGLATQADIARLERRIGGMAPAKKTAAKKATTKKRAGAKKAGAKKRAGAKKAGAKRAGTKRAAARKSAARRPTKKATAKKSTAKKSAKRT